MPLYAGVCQTDITPPLGVWMCGYAFRPTGCTSIHDPLSARALVLNDGNGAIVILSMDLLGLDFDLVDAVRSGIERETGIPQAAIMLAATHTHGGPNVGQLNCMGYRDPAYTDILVRKLIGIATQASSEMRPAELLHARRGVQIGVNRRQYDRDGGRTVIGHNYGGPVQPWVDVVVVRAIDDQEEPIAILFAHACHPTTLGGENLAITADFPGYACRFINKNWSDVPALFLQGCCGNINPMPRGTFDNAQTNGEMLGLAVDQTIRSAMGEPSLGSVHHAERTIDLPLLPPPSLPDIEKNIAHWKDQAEQCRQTGDQGKILHAEGLQRYYELERDNAGQSSKPFTLQCLEAGGIRFLGMPAEMFVQYGNDFQNQAEGPVIPVAYSNGVHGYVPIAADYPYGGYEVDYAHKYYHTLMYSPECEIRIRRAAYELLGIESPDMTPYSM